VAEGWRPRPPRVLAALRASYRSRLTVSLMAFFLMPVLGFGVWSFARLTDDARRAGDLLVQQALRDAALAAGSAALETPSEGAREIVSLGRALDADLWLYRGARLVGASAPVLGELGLVDAFLDPAVFVRLGFEDEIDLTVAGVAAGRSLRVGYRVVRAGPPDQQAVLAAPRLLDDERVRRQQADLALSLILGTVAGVAAALLLAARVARGLERPVAALREAAEAVGRGAAPPPFPAEVPAEFTTVVTSFQRMAGDVRRSQAAIEEARERTARVLANVATGVIAVDAGLRVTLANPQAAQLLGTPLAPGDDLRGASGPDWAPVWDDVAVFLAGRPADIAEREFDVAGRRIRVQLAPLGPEPDGCVVALDDTTELSRAARVLAWGEMARQVAHEIKNPLTPIRLGIQHLQRTRGDQGDFERTFGETAARILVEIDRLDAIARAFSRFGAPGAERQPLEAVDLHALAREVVQLYSLGGEPSPAAVRFRVWGEGGAPALARRDEVKEVLVNLLENARQAGARTVAVRIEEDGTTLTVEDDGQGIPPEALGRVFEPRFSTTSSGAGLGLAIARRLVESWGGEIGITSEVGRGTRVWLRLRAGGAPG
ncbi:MAG TPA: ATP-binding protein, partial [Pseudonocardia sp.]|nr:ATP-binding protein [Pseudonocardia sp.]